MDSISIRVKNAGDPDFPEQKATTVLQTKSIRSTLETCRRCCGAGEMRICL